MFNVSVDVDTGPSYGCPMMSRVLEAIRRGGMVVVTDDADRENEGDLVMAADAVTPEAIAFMAVRGRGLICLSMEPERLDALEIGPMVLGGAPAETNFTVSIDFDEPGSTGISAADRARTIRHAVNPAALPRDFRRPGHVFPLRYTPGGVLARRGHTEASVDLARLAGRAPAGVICEILNDDGTLARGAELTAFAARHGLPLTSVAEIADHLATGAATRSVPGPVPAAAVAEPRQPVPAHATDTAVTVAEPQVTRVARTVLPSRYGSWRTDGYRGTDGLEYVVLSLGEPEAGDAPPLVRLHSECLTGDALGSMRCDCGDQLDLAMRRIADEGSGVIVYIRGHEGRGIGLLPKLQAYELQDAGLDTVDANLALGYRDDARTYPGAAAVLRELGIASVRLLTNNLDKVAGLRDHGITVTRRIPLVAAPSPVNLRYLTTKQKRMGHVLHGLSAG